MSAQLMSTYVSWWKFDKVMTKTILLVFLRHGVLSTIVADAVGFC